jgi:very-short-patch-repair endonuclease
MLRHAGGRSLPACGEGWGGAGRGEADRAGGSPRMIPPHAGGRSLPVYGEGWGGASRGRAGRGEANQEGATLIPIESIQPGDWVLGHDGQPHRVVRVIRRLYRGRMIGIRHEKTDTTLWLSADHKVLAKRRPRSLGGHNDWSGIPPVLRGRSKTLRREMTPPERKLWAVLRNGQTGFTFRRQHPIGRYIADFYSRDAQLVVEVDGVLAHSSEEALAHDQARDAYLRGLGLEVLRIPAREVLSQSGRGLRNHSTHLSPSAQRREGRVGGSAGPGCG